MPTARRMATEEHRDHGEEQAGRDLAVADAGSTTWSVADPSTDASATVSAPNRGCRGWRKRRSPSPFDRHRQDREPSRVVAPGGPDRARAPRSRTLLSRRPNGPGSPRYSPASNSLQSPPERPRGAGSPGASPCRSRPPMLRAWPASPASRHLCAQGEASPVRDSAQRRSEGRHPVRGVGRQGPHLPSAGPRAQPGKRGRHRDSRALRADRQGDGATEEAAVRAAGRAAALQPAQLLRPVAGRRVVQHLEFFVHDGDIRRAQQGWRRRNLPDDFVDTLWQTLKAQGTALVRSAGCRSSCAHDTEETTNLDARAGLVELTGAVTEVIFVPVRLGRGARGVVLRAGEKVAKLRRADLGLLAEPSSGPGGPAAASAASTSPMARVPKWKTLGRQHGVGACVDGRREVLGRPHLRWRSPARRPPAYGADQVEVEPLMGAVGVHGVRAGSPRPRARRHGWPTRARRGRRTCGRRGWSPRSRTRCRSTGGRRPRDEHLVAEAVGDLGHQLGPLDGGGVDGTLSAPARSSLSTSPALALPADRQGMKTCSAVRLTTSSVVARPS